MTTPDPFAEAAADAAEDARKRALDGPPNGTYDGHFLLGFRMGSTWARTHLAAQDEATIRALATTTAHTGLDIVEAARIMRSVTQEPTAGERAVRELHWGDKSRYAHTCAEDGQVYPCATIRALDSARAARRDEEKRDG